MSKLGENYFNYQAQELKDKIKKLEEANVRLGVEVNFKIQDNSRLNDDLLSKIEEIKFYESELGININPIRDESQYPSSFQNYTIDETKSEDRALLENTTRRDKDISSFEDEAKEEVQHNDDEEEISNIGNILDGLLKEYLLSMSEHKILLSNSQPQETFNLFCSSVMVILVDSNSSDDILGPKFYLQTFKIDLTTTFVELNKAILSIWDLKEKQNDYILKFVDENGNTSGIKSETESVDAFIKGQSNMKKAKFIYIPKSLKLNKDLKTVGTRLQEENSENKKITIDSKADKFVSKFLGLSNYLQNKLITFKKRVENPNADYNGTTGIISKIANFFHALIITMFVFYTFESLSIKSPPNLSFYINETFRKKFDPTTMKKDYLNKEMIQNDIIDRLNELFYDGALQKKVLMISQVRFSFYRVKLRTEKCKFVTTKCYENYYSLLTAATMEDRLNYFEHSQFLNDSIFFQPKTNITNEYFIQSSNLSVSNFIQSAENLKIFYNKTFSSFNKVNTNIFLATKLEGNLARYYGLSYDFYINIQSVNRKVLQTALEITRKDQVLWDEGLRAIAVQFAYFHPQSGFYYYISILYEITPNSLVFIPIVTVDFFKTNIYEGSEGQVLKALDATRTSIGCLQLIFLILDIFLDKKEIYSKDTKANIFTVIFRAKIISEFVTTILFFVCYGLKRSLLTDIEMTYWQGDNTQGWEQKNITEFYWTAFSYFVDNVLESVVFFFTFWRFCTIFYTFNRVKTFAFMMYYSLTKIYSYLIIMIGIVISFSIVSNNLFGSYGSNYSNFATCFSNVLMVSIGHFSLPDKRVETYWVCVYILLVLIIIVFFFLSTFAGMFLESFRIVSLRKGYAFDKKNIDSDGFFNFIGKINKKKFDEIKLNLEKAIKDKIENKNVGGKKQKDFKKVKQQKEEEPQKQ